MEQYFNAGQRKFIERRSHRRALCALLLCGAVIPAPAWAQERTADQAVAASAEDQNVPGEIVVTARRRAEQSRDVPMSIISAGADVLNERAVRSALDLPTVAPGLSATNQSARGGIPLYSIRGQYQAFGGTGPGVVVYFADVPDFARQIYDLDSIQVLKGPQGTLFGRNTTGGAVLFAPKKPTSEFSGYVTVRAGSYSRRDIEGAIGGGTEDGSVAVRVAGQYLSASGYTRNLFDGVEYDDEDKLSLRGSLVLKPASWLENYTIGEYYRRRENGTGTSIAGYSPGFFLDPALAAAVGAQLAAQRARGPRTINIEGRGGSNENTYGVVNTTTATLGKQFVLKNIFSYRHTDSFGGFDYDGTPLALAYDAGPVGNGTEMLTEEVQLRWSTELINATVGFYHEWENTNPHTFFRYAPFRNVNPASGVTTIYSLDNFSKRTSDAFYGEATITPTEKLALTAGIRHTTDYRTGGAENAIYLGPNSFLRLGATVGTYQGSATTWNLNALYKITPDLNFYSKVARGYRSGGVNNTTSGTGGVLFKPETVTDYELGLKYAGRLGGLRIRANIDAFFDDYKNIQRTVTNPPPGVTTRTDNAAVGQTWGADFDFQLYTSTASLQVSYSLLNTKYNDYFDLRYGDLSKGLFPGAPKHQLVIVPRVTPIQGDAGTVSLQGVIYHQSEVTYDVYNTPNGNPITNAGANASITPGYWKVDLRADWKNIRGTGLSVAAYMLNVFDEAYATGTLNRQPDGATGVIAYSYGAPRTFAVEFSYAF